MDRESHRLLEDALRGTMRQASGGELDSALGELGWADMLTEMPDTAIPLVFRLLGETGAHAPVINDVVSHEMGQGAGMTHALPYAGGRWVTWWRDEHPSHGLDEEIPLTGVDVGAPVPLAMGRRALGWWLVGSARAMLDLARQHAVDRSQFGARIASFQAVRHRLAETLVAIEGAEAALTTANDDLGSLLAKAASGQAALLAAKHCQQILGGMGFTAEHALHRHVKRVFVLDGLLNSTRELLGVAGSTLREKGSAPRLAQL